MYHVGGMTSGLTEPADADAVRLLLWASLREAMMVPPTRTECTIEIAQWYRQCFVSQVSIKQCEFSQGMLLLHPWRHKRYGPVVATRPTRFGSNSMGGSGLVPQMLAIC